MLNLTTFKFIQLALLMTTWEGNRLFDLQAATKRMETQIKLKQI